MRQSNTIALWWLAAVKIYTSPQVDLRYSFNKDVLSCLRQLSLHWCSGSFLISLVVTCWLKGWRPTELRSICQVSVWNSPWALLHRFWLQIISQRKLVIIYCKFFSTTAWQIYAVNLTFIFLLLWQTLTFDVHWLQSLCVKPPYVQSIKLTHYLQCFTVYVVSVEYVTWSVKNFCLFVCFLCVSSSPLHF